jgi:RsiW-degrading membrane proteinase PrsW (M82 family)
MFDHSPRKANIALLVALVVLAVGVAIVGRDPSEAETLPVVVATYVAGIATLGWLYRREDRARERERRSRPDA